MGFHHIHQSRDHNGCQHRNRKISDKSGAKKKNQSHGDPGSDGNCLRFSPVLFIEGGTGNTAVYRTASHSGSRNVSCCTGQDLLSVVQFIVIAEGKSVLCKKGFRHNDNGNHKAAAYCLGQINISEIRDHQGREAAFYRLQKYNALFIHMKNNGGENTQGHDRDGHGKFWCQFFEYADQYQRAKSHAEGKPAYIFCGSEDMLCQLQKFTGTGRASHQLRDLHQDDGDCDTADKTTHYRCGNEINDLVCMEQEEHKQPQTCKKCNGRDITHGGFRFRGNAKGRQCAAYNGSRCRVNSEDKLP